MEALPGRPFPLGATPRDGGTNFAVMSDLATGVMLCLFDDAGHEQQVPLLDCDANVWHGFVPGIGVGQSYGFRPSVRMIRLAGGAATRTNSCWIHTPKRRRAL